MKVRETGSAGGEISQILILYSNFVVAVFEHNDDDLVKVVSAGFRARRRSSIIRLLRSGRRSLRFVRLRGQGRLCSAQQRSNRDRCRENQDPAKV
jgi:hypothetical protein